MATAKPDCTAQKFGSLTVLGKAEIIKDKSGRSRQLWELKCDCGKIVKRPRDSFDRVDRRSVSCGCAKRQRMRELGRKNLIDISGQRFGSLVAIELSLSVRHYDRPAWKLRCDCGGIVFWNSRRLKSGCYLNCGNRRKHPENWLHYPLAPDPFPAEAGVIVAKYLHLVRSRYSVVDSAIEDSKLDKLLRAAWIICYRRRSGEILSEQYERRFILKHLRYCSIDVFWMRKIESSGGFLYNRCNQIKQIGSTMTDLTSNFEVVNPQGETQPELICSNRPVRKAKFRRC